MQTIGGFEVEVVEALPDGGVGVVLVEPPPGGGVGVGLAEPGRWHFFPLWHLEASPEFPRAI